MAASNGLRRATDREVETGRLQIGLDEIGEIMRGRVLLFPWPDRCRPRSRTKAALVSRVGSPRKRTVIDVDWCRFAHFEKRFGRTNRHCNALGQFAQAASSKLRVAMSFDRTVIYKSAWLEMM